MLMVIPSDIFPLLPVSTLLFVIHHCTHRFLLLTTRFLGSAIQYLGIVEGVMMEGRDLRFSLRSNDLRLAIYDNSLTD